MSDEQDLDELTSQKARLREEANVRRNALLPHVRTQKSHAIIERLRSLAVYDKARKPLIYVAMPSEVQTLPLIASRIGQGLPVAVPRVEGENLGLYEISAIGDLKPGVWGILEPEQPGARPVALEDVDVVILPGVVFDPVGHRLGYGKAFYDRLLSRLSHPVTKVALAFEVQLVRAVPSEPHDATMDFIVTEERTIDCRSARDQAL